jgi:hypothetical protein
MRFRAQSKLHTEQDAQHDVHAPQDWTLYLRDLVAQPTAVLCRMLDSLEVRAYVCIIVPAQYFFQPAVACCIYARNCVRRL